MTKTSRRIFFLLSVLLLGSDLCFVVINYLSSQKALSATVDQMAQGYHFRLDQSLNATKSKMLLLATFLSQDPRIQKLFLEGKRAVLEEEGTRGIIEANKVRMELLAILSKGRRVLEKEFGFRQIQFHLGPGSLSFLRVHAPDRFGDRMDDVRFTVVDVNKYHRSVYGFEIGRVYSGIRGVVPVFARDDTTGKELFVGALEAGTAFDSTLHAVKGGPSMGLAVFLNIDILKTKMWPDELKRLINSSSTIGNFVVESSTSDLAQEIFRLHLAQNPSLHPSTLHVFFGGVDYSSTTFPLRDYQGEKDPSLPPVGQILLWRDISDELSAFKRTQLINIIYALGGFVVIEISLFAGIRASSKRLKAIISQKSQEQVLMAAELEKAKACESIKGIVASMAHLINNKTTAIVLGLQMLKGSLPPGSKEHDWADKAMRATKETAQLGKTLLATLGELQVDTKSFSLHKLVQKMVAAHRDLLTDGVKLTIHRPHAQVKVFADEELVGTALSSLLKNSIEAMSSTGEITISFDTITADPSSFPMPYAREGKRGRFVVVTIEDTGEGMEETTLERATEPFFSTKFQGRGLGLPLAAGIIRANKGAIYVKSVKGQGTSIAVLLPASDV